MARRLPRTARKVFRQDDSAAVVARPNVTKKLNKCRLNPEILGKVGSDTNYLMMLSCSPEDPGSEDAGWAAVFETLAHCFRLAKLSLEWCQLTDPVAELLCRSLPQLSELHLRTSCATQPRTCSRTAASRPSAATCAASSC